MVAILNPMIAGGAAPRQVRSPSQADQITVRALEPAQYQSWDDFVTRHPHGSPFHLVAWKRSMEATFGYPAHYLAAWRGSELRGVLPLFLVKNLFLKKALISSPFAVYGGVLGDGEQTRHAMRESIEALGVELGVEYVELRNAHPDQVLGFHPLKRFVTFTQQVGPDEQAILESIPRKTRYMVRKALKEDFSTRRRKDLSEDFLRLYLENLRKLGTPAFPEKHFQQLFANFAGMIDIREVLKDDKVVSAVLSLYFQDQMLPYYGASDPSVNAAAPNNYMYFDQMRWGGQNGYRVFDFGRSKKESGGSYDFKSHWGMMERELPYEILLVRGKNLPHFSPSNPRFQMFIQLWRRLPLPLTRVLGPLLIRLVP